jgi:hypothetical protein
MPTLTPSERATLPATKRAKHPSAPIPAYLEIVFAGAVSVRLHGDVAPATLTHILEWAARR